MTIPKIDTKKRSFFQDRKMWFWIAAGSGLVTLLVLVIFLQSLISTTKYYVLNQDVPARTPIDVSMLQEQVVSAGGQPPTAIDVSAVGKNKLFAKTSLKAGDILTKSNAGDLIPLRQGIPDEFVVASFSADPNSSAGGNIKRGNYVDVFYTADGQSHLVFQRLLVLDTTTDLNSGAKASTKTDSAASTTGGAGSAPAAASTDSTSTSAYRSGVPFLYTVGMTQADALKLAATTGGKLYVVLSSATDVNNTNGVPSKTLGMSLNDVLSSPAIDSGKGTDNTFGVKKAAATPAATPSANPSPAPTQAASPTSTPTPSSTVKLDTGK